MFKLFECVPKFTPAFTNDYTKLPAEFLEQKNLEIDPDAEGYVAIFAPGVLFPKQKHWRVCFFRTNTGPTFAKAYATRQLNPGK